MTCDHQYLGKQVHLEEFTQTRLIKQLPVKSSRQDVTN